MWFFKQYQVVFLDRNEIVIAKNEKGYPKVLNIPSQIYSFLDLQDSHYFEKLLYNFLLQAKFKEEVVIVLSDNMTYNFKAESQNAKSSEFFDYFKLSLPLSDENIVLAQFASGDNVYLSAANKHFVNAARRCLENSGSSIRGIVPEVLIETIKKPKNFEEMGDIINKNKNFISKANLE